MTTTQTTPSGPGYCTASTCRCNVDNRDAHELVAHSGRQLTRPLREATAAPATYQVGDAVFVTKGINTNDTVRENVPAVVVGCRGMIVVVNRTDEGRYSGEGLWAFTSDLHSIVERDPADPRDTQHDEDRDYDEEEYNRRTMHEE